jgi:hypothetical protein
VPYMRREGLQLVGGVLYSVRCKNRGSRACRPGLTHQKPPGHIQAIFVRERLW